MHLQLVPDDDIDDDIDKDITERAVARCGTTHDPRLAELMQAVVRNLHNFAREVRLTEPEWMAAMQWLARTGRISDHTRAEFILASDVLGLSMLVVDMNHRLDPGATPATVLGPFHIAGSPELAYGGDMSDGLPGVPLFVTGMVRDLDGDAVGGAVLDVWQADPEGTYESQLDVNETRLRAKYTSKPDGAYCLRTVAPRGYTIPMDGPVGELISHTDIRPFRPAHIHFLIDVPGYEPLTTHLFQKGAKYLDSDVVFGTKGGRVRAARAGSRPGRGHVERAVAPGDVRLHPAAELLTRRT
ncbi:dioxygenase family protein [Mycolicibacterium baixiangningiae]|uniref:dioxygenase family protein n=1 Tax=Mycolicibacterium baixiangningiae TaxID=2761578 RepID=UPI0018E5EC9B|nr:dioxygenase [Mycolicibacterium baixiangningiae]